MAPHAKSELIRYTAACVFAVCAAIYVNPQPTRTAAQSKPVGMNIPVDPLLFSPQQLGEGVFILTRLRAKSLGARTSRASPPPSPSHHTY